MKPVIIVQARLGSTRLPGKVLRPIGARQEPMLAFMLRRLTALRDGTQIIAAVPAHDRTRFSAARPLPGNVGFWCGSEQDVLGRYYDAARVVLADTVVRLTSDCPLIDPAVVDRALDQFAAGGCDYLSTSHPLRVLPSGFDVEVMSFAALERAHFGCDKPEHREHVTPCLYRGECCAGRFRTAPLSLPELWPAPHPHLSVDTEEDFARVDALLRQLPENFTYLDVKALLHA